jgi:hypothetical protein
MLRAAVKTCYKSPGVEVKERYPGSCVSASGVLLKINAPVEDAWLKSNVRQPLYKAFRYPRMPKGATSRRTYCYRVTEIPTGNSGSLIAGAKPVLQVCYLDGVQSQSLSLKNGGARLTRKILQNLNK